MRYLVLLISLAFVACGGRSADDYSADEEVEEAAESIGATFHDALEAAEAVEDDLMEAKKGIDDALDETR